MLRKIYIIKEKFLYERNFGKSLSDTNIINLFKEIKKDAFSRLDNDIGGFFFYNYRISYIAEKDLALVFIFVNEISDDSNIIKTELFKLKKDFLNYFSDNINDGLDHSLIELITPTVDAIHRNLKPKISIVGYSGVGKTTISKLIKAEKTPIEHIPTINGEISTIKIGKLYFSLWDFAGQEQFSFLWNKFIKGSDVVLLITDSTLENVDKSKFFIELIKEEAPYARSAMIANKQDMPNVLDIETIERISGLKTYSMVAINSNNRIKMINIISDILDISIETFHLLKPLYKRDQLVNDATIALEREDFERAAILFERIAEICFEIGDEYLGKEFYEKSEKLKRFLSGITI